MVAYMKRYDPGNELVSSTVRAVARLGRAGRSPLRARPRLLRRLDGGHRSPADGTQRIRAAAPTEEHLPSWLPEQWARSYVSYLQQYTHNVNLLRFFLDAGDEIRCAHVDLDPDGYTGVVVLDVGGVRAQLETGQPALLSLGRAHPGLLRARLGSHLGAAASPPQRGRRGRDLPEQSGRPGAAQHTTTRPIPEPRWGWAYKREAEHFVQCLQTGRPSARPARTPLPTFGFSRRSSDLAAKFSLILYLLVLQSSIIPPATSVAGCKAAHGRLCCFLGSCVRTNVYVDGFNLYYGCLKGSRFKWLDLGRLCALLLPNYQIARIRYFTAKVRPRPDDPQKHIRQMVYLRALQTIPNLSIHYGHYLSHTVRMPLAHPRPGGPSTVEVIKTEEKGRTSTLPPTSSSTAFRTTTRPRWLSRTTRTSGHRSRSSARCSTGRLSSSTPTTTAARP